MAMSPKCIQAVQAAAGARPISPAKLAKIEDAIARHRTLLARADRTRWLGLTRDQQITEGAIAAMKEIEADAALKVFRAAQQVLRAAESDERIKMHRALNGLTESQALIRETDQTMQTGDATTKQAVAGMADLLDAAESKDGTGIMRNLAMRIFGVDNPRMTADIVREVFREADGHTGNAVAKAGAKAWLDTIEALRVRFNAAGGDIGKLGYGYLAQAHDTVRVKEMGPQAWAAKVLPLLDRKQYLHPDGRIMADADVLAMLEAAHDTIATEGRNKQTPGQFKGSGARANHGSEHRVLHFADGDAWMAYMGDFGEGSLYDAMIGHVGRMGRDVALVERHGPNPEQWFRVRQDMAQLEDRPGSWASRSAGNQPAAYWKLATGATGTPEHRLIAQVGRDARNIQTAAKITWGPLSALSDIGTIAATLHFDRIPYFAYMQAVGRQFSADHRAELQAHGVVADSLMNTLNRFTGDHLMHGLSGRLTEGVMRLSLMNTWTNTLRDAFSDVMMHNWASRAGQAWGQLDEWDRYLLQRQGIAEAEWNVIAQAVPTDIGGRAFLTHDSITAAPGATPQIADAWMRFVGDESMTAVVNPDAATRAIATGGGMPAGTVNGEVMRSVTQFKSFPIAMLTRHWRRVIETPQGMEGAPLGFRGEGDGAALVNRIAVLAAFGVTTTLLGAIQTQSRAIAGGKDPIDMTGDHAAKFWAKSFAAGGGSGFIADVFLAPMDDPSRQWQGHLGLLGPVAGALGGLVDVAKGEGPEGDKQHVAPGIRWLSDQAPGVDIWQVRALYEHWFLHSAQEALNPGYLSRMQRRAQKDWGQSYYWPPGEAAPGRAPDMAGAFGQ